MDRQHTVVKNNISEPKMRNDFFGNQYFCSSNYSITMYIESNDEEAKN